MCVYVYYVIESKAPLFLCFIGKENKNPFQLNYTTIQSFLLNISTTFLEIF